VASDLREGKVTMAVIHALNQCSPAERKLIETVLEERAFATVQHQQILEMLNRYGSIQYAYDEAARHAEAARNAICSFPDSEIKRALLALPEFVVERSS
jgi:octaprenyl-diphosphate synthase